MALREEILIMNVQDIIDLSRNEKSIYLYGAGKIGREVLHFFGIHNVSISAFIVSNSCERDVLVDGVRVIEITDGQIDRSNSLVIVSMADNNSRELVGDNTLQGFKKIIFLNTRMIDYVKKCNMVSSCSPQYLLSDKEDKIENKMMILKDGHGKKLFRVMESFGQDSYEMIRERCVYEEFEKEYGELVLYEDLDNEPIKDNFVVYVATSHLDKMMSSSLKQFEQAIQVGCALTDVRKGYICDNEGENISCRNHLYSECTGLYWMWKNAPYAKYIGLEHYRRRLKLSGNPQVDVIVALPQFVGKKVKDFFVPSMIIPKDWELMKEYACAYDNNYEELIHRYEANYFYFSCNLCVFRRELLDEFCEFAFGICFKIDDYYEQRNIVRNDRYMGYIFENLLSLYILKNYSRLKITCAEVEWVE